MPKVEVDFQPYATNGHWVMTDYGWTWASNYKWGWAAFHYGRWMYEPSYGWMWLPGRTWGPAWVSWRQSNDYYGWAPLGYHRRGVSISFGIPIEHYHFAPVRYMTQPVLTKYILNRTQNNVIVNKTVVVNNVRVVNKTKIIGGPSVNHYQQVSGQKITTVRIKENANARVAVVDKENFQVYRPQIAAARSNQAAAKNNVVRSEQNATNQPKRQRPMYEQPNQNVTNQPIKERSITERPNQNENVRPEKLQNQNAKVRKPCEGVARPEGQVRKPYENNGQQRTNADRPQRVKGGKKENNNALFI